MPAPAAVFFVPEDLESGTGGNIYDRRVIAGLRERGWSLRIEAFARTFPQPSIADLAEAQARLARQPDGGLVVVDGLGFGAMPEAAAHEGQRLRLVALVHHPLADETGLDEARRAELFESERAALACARGVIVTSAFTRDALAAYGVPEERIAVARPGTDPAPLAAGSDGREVDLLSVGTVTPRKGHLDLVESLVQLTDLPWRLTIVGSTGRHPATAAALRERIARHGLDARVELAGEVESSRLPAYYRRSDLFVLPSHHEGYGMALTEALAAGLPVVSTTAGAIPETLAAGGARLVPPGDVPALREVLADLIGRPGRLADLRCDALAARDGLPRWSETVTRFEQALRDYSDDDDRD